MQNKLRCYAACSFGLEAVVARELEALGIGGIESRDARVYFEADARHFRQRPLTSCLKACVQSHGSNTFPATPPFR